MRTTINVDDDLLAEAKAMFGDFKVADILNQAIKEKIQAESARRLADLGGSDPDCWAPARGSSLLEESEAQYGS